MKPVQNFDMHKVYTRTKNGFVEYKGGVNFLNGERTCPKCNGTMVREVIGQQYLSFKEGKILVDTTGILGRMVVSHTKPEYIWLCRGCENSIRPKT